MVYDIHLYKYILTFCLILFGNASVSQASQDASESPTIHVLFIGNSLTFMNHLPDLIAQLAESRHHLMEHDMYAPGGYTLFQHASDPVLRAKINKGIWDFVVIQEQSQLPALREDRFEAQVLPYARKLCQMVRDANPKAQVVFYMTMAKKNGDPMNARYVPEVGTYEGMQERINAGYKRMAEQNQGLLVPVGEIWKNVRAERPDINLYKDDTHPNVTGTYLAACAFYAVLFKDSPVGLSYPEQIDDPIADYLQKMTAQSN